MRRPRLVLVPNEPKKAIASEYQECKAFWQYCQCHPMLRDHMIKNVNEGIREVWYARALLATGLRPGLPDYHYPVPNSSYHGLWLEFKRSDKRHAKKNPEQVLWIERLNKIGHYASYAYGCDDAIEILNSYLANTIKIA